MSPIAVHLPFDMRDALQALPTSALADEIQARIESFAWTDPMRFAAWAVAFGRCGPATWPAVVALEVAAGRTSLSCAADADADAMFRDPLTGEPVEFFNAVIANVLRRCPLRPDTDAAAAVFFCGVLQTLAARQVAAFACLDEGFELALDALQRGGEARAIAARLLPFAAADNSDDHGGDIPLHWPVLAARLGVPFPYPEEQRLRPDVRRRCVATLARCALRACVAVDLNPRAAAWHRVLRQELCSLKDGALDVDADADTDADLAAIIRWIEASAPVF